VGWPHRRRTAGRGVHGRVIANGETVSDGMVRADVGTLRE
jgi:hypothetical protein